MARLSREDMFLEIATLVAERSTCTRADVGAVIVRDGRILSMGYNGAPPGMPHCEDVGCETVDGLEMREIAGVTVVLDPQVGDRIVGLRNYNPGCERTIHAEANALAWSAREGIAVKGAEMYCTHAPCYACAKLMVSAGISRVHYNIEYRDERGIRLLDKALVEVIAHGSKAPRS